MTDNHAIVVVQGSFTQVELRDPQNNVVVPVRHLTADNNGVVQLDFAPGGRGIIHGKHIGKTVVTVEGPGITEQITIEVVDQFPADLEPNIEAFHHDLLAIRETLREDR